MDDPDTANNIMLTFISMPYLLVLDPLTHLFYIPDDSIAQLNTSSVGKFLLKVKAEKVMVRVFLLSLCFRDGDIVNTSICHSVTRSPLKHGAEFNQTCYMVPTW